MRHRAALLGYLVALWLPGLAVARDSDTATPSPAALALRRQYNGVAAAIDTLVRLYSAERFTRLAEAEADGGVRLPPGSRLVLLFWADDEARIYLNGAPVGETRLTPTRIEIPAFYVQADNVLTARCWDTDRVESGFMAGLYVEDDAGLRPVLTTADAFAWQATGLAGGRQPAREIYYAHTQPDLPAAEVMWGPQLFGEVQLQTRFTAADVERAARRAPLAATAPVGVRQRTMDFHQVVGRLVGLQRRLQELHSRLEAGASRPDADLRFGGGPSPGLSYTLGAAGRLQEEIDTEAVTALQRWARQLPPEQAQLVLHEARRLRGPDEATPPAPLEDTAPGHTAGERRADYRPPEDRGTAGEGKGQTGSDTGIDGGIVVVPSTGFMLRMLLVAVALAAWSGGAGWRARQLWSEIKREGRAT